MSKSNPSTLSSEALELAFKQTLTSGVGKKLPHESAERHVSGEARYIDDQLEYPNHLHLYARLSEQAHATITKLDVNACRQYPGVACVITADDIPGQLDIGAVLPGDPLLAHGKVEYWGQPLFVVAAPSYDIAREAAQLATIEYAPLETLLDVKEALHKKQFVMQSHQHKRGDAHKSIANASHRLKGQLNIGGQEHFYLETQVSNVIPTEDGGMLVYCSTQNPTEVQKLVASVLGLPMHKITIDMRRMGGGFGGKETQAAGPACLAAVVAQKTGMPAKMRLARSDDMMMTGKRHPFFVEYDVGFDQKGVLQGVNIELSGNCGFSPDLSGSIVDRAMFHADNAYYLGDALITGHRCKTHIASNTAYRGFGGPQGMLAIENIMDEIARFLGEDPLTVRERNLYGQHDRNITHYYQTIEDNPIKDILEQVKQNADYRRRRKQIIEFNNQHPFLRKGIALTPVKFGISFTAGFLNQAGALIHIYTDGSIQLNHGGTEMGQGLNTKVAQIVAEELQVSIERIQITATDTSKVPNTSPTAASSGADLNGKAAQAAARTLKQRLINFAAERYNVDTSAIIFKNNCVQVGEALVSFDALVQDAYFSQVSLSSTGFYKTPKIHYDRDSASGHPFYSFAWGASCSEVIVDTLTGEYKVLRTDILHDVGASLNPAIDIGQIEGGFIQGMGWLTTEELCWNEHGRLMTNSPASYKIPAISDTPLIFNVDLVENRKNPEDTVYHSKAVGEPPFMLSISVWCAIKDAVSSLSDYRYHPDIDAPATPEKVLLGIEKLKHQLANREPLP